MDSPSCGMEALSAATNIGAIGDVVQDIRVSVENQVDEANGTLADGEALFVDLQGRHMLAT
jgi:hypothetical protein